MRNEEKSPTAGEKKNGECATKRMKPWLIGLVIISIGTVVWAIFSIKKDDFLDTSARISNKDRAMVNSNTKSRAQGSVNENTGYDYKKIVELVKPGIVGISLPGAKPFLQAWPSQKEQGLPFQQQVWQPSVSQQQPQQTQTTSREEFLECQNCRVRIDPQPGIPMSNAKCPNCGMNMARIIRETRSNSLVPIQTVVAASTIPLVAPNNPSTQELPGIGGITQNAMNGIGTGIVISKKGYILTSYHIISGYKEVNVTLFTPSGTKSLIGKVIAQASDRDIAILQIDPVQAGLELVSLAIGNSDIVKIGDQVLAFGNPYGLAQTVTSGIVSSIRQTINIDGHNLSNVIQTDAPINEGNSGGPLVNRYGEVIGINVAIYSPGQTHTGLGFAISSNQAKEVFSSYMDTPVQKVGMQFLDYPKAYPAAVPQTQTNEDSPVWLGINIQLLNDVIAEQMRIPVDSGILINEVYPNSPAQEAGLERGDVIIRINGKRITDETQLRLILADRKPNDKIKLDILRGRKKITIKIKLAGGVFNAALTQNQQNINLLKGAEIEAGGGELASIGLGVASITPEVAFAFGLPEQTQGVVISEVEGLALQSGVKEGDVVKGVNGKVVLDLVSFFKTIKNCNLKDGLSLQILRNGNPMSIVIKEQPQNLPKGL